MTVTEILERYPIINKKWELDSEYNCDMTKFEYFISHRLLFEKDELRDAWNRKLPKKYKLSTAWAGAHVFTTSVHGIKLTFVLENLTIDEIFRTNS